MFRKVLLVAIVTFALGGCASVPMESTEASNEAKQFSLPSKDKSGLYIYRDSFVGGAGLELIDRGAGMDAVSKLELAKSGTCSK